MNWKPAIIALLTLLLGLPAARAAGDDNAIAPGSAALALADAEAWFARGLALRGTDPQASIGAFERAAAGYRLVREEFGVRNHRLEVNLGNASLLAGDQGRATLAYLRAERLAPLSPSVRQSLAHLRSRVGTQVEPSIRERMIGAAFAWRGVAPRGVLVWIMVIGYVGVWALASAKVLGVRIRPWAVVACALPATMSLALLLAEQTLLLDSARAVVVSKIGVEARLGPDAGVYAKAFDSRLPAGLECIVLEAREDWARVRLRDARECWIPLDAIEPIGG